MLLAHAPEIAASTGSACHADDESPSAVVTAMGPSNVEALGSVGLSMGGATTAADVALAIDVLWRAYVEVSVNENV